MLQAQAVFAFASNRPSLAVFPFTDHSPESEQAYFCRGFVDDLLAELSRFPSLAVVAPSSSDAVNRGTLSTQYLLSGTLRRAGHQLRVSAQLLDGKTRSVIWAERFDRAAEDVFQVQDEIVAQVVAAVSRRVQATALALAKRKPPKELAAYEHWLRGHDLLKQGSLAADEEARNAFSQALELDPEYARAHVGLSLSYFNEWSCQLWHCWDDNECGAFDHARRAHELDSQDHYAHLVLGRVLLFRRRFEQAEHHLEQALALNPNDADCLIQLAMAFALLGRKEQAGALMEQAQKLNPQHEPWYWAYAAVVAFAAEQFEAAVEYTQRVDLGVMVDLPALAAAAHQHLGNEAAARESLNLYLKQHREKIATGRDVSQGEALRWLQQVNPYRNVSDEARLLGAVHAVGQTGTTPPTAIEPSMSRNTFKRVGSLWQVSFRGRDAWLPSLKGYADLATLLASPGQEVDCSRLMGKVETQSEDEHFDDDARRAYQTHLARLKNDLESALDTGNQERAGHIRAEMEGLAAHLKRGLGLGGRSRPLAASSEKARAAVTQRIKAALKRTEEPHPALYQHLQATIRTGRQCSYAPEIAVDWEL